VAEKTDSKGKKDRREVLHRDFLKYTGSIVRVIKMTAICRFVFAALLIVLPLNGCSTPTQKTSAQEDDQTSATAEYLGKGKYTGSYWPTKEWRECKPETVGMNSEKLLKAIEYAATPSFNTDGLAVIRKGHIVGEAYLEFPEKVANPIKFKP
jgi:hypothetical protein